MTGHAVGARLPFPGSLKGRVALGLVVGALAVTALALAIALIITAQYDGRVLPGVRAGGFDVGGLAPAEARHHLEAAFSRLSDGSVDVETPSGTASISYADVGRAVDLDATVAAALAAGRDRPLASVLGIMTAIERPDVPVTVKLDHAALDARLADVARRGNLAASDAYVIAQGTFQVVAASPGKAIDPTALGSAIASRLHDPAAPPTFDVATTPMVVAAGRSDDEAAAAAAAANRMAADVVVTVNAKTFRIGADRIRQLITFGSLPTGAYGPLIDTSALRSDVAEIGKKVNVAPVPAKFVLGATGKPTGVTGGTAGVTLDVDGTVASIERELAARRDGASAAAVAAPIDTVQPALTADAARGYVSKMAKASSWTVKFYPDVSNGFGANIRIPARNIDGTLVLPDEVFSFFKAVGPIDEAHGFKQGGVIKNGKSYPTGAIGGGICSASTTMFNAALRGGFEIVERQAHYYFIDRYPIGLDATVFSDGNTTVDLRWRNDSKYPILIRGYADYGSITFELWTVPDGRKVAPIPARPAVWNVVKATNRIEYVNTLAPGVRQQQEYPHDGYDTVVGRVVYDASGKVIHNDTFRSHYGKVDGVLLIGAPPAPRPTAAPTRSPSPVPSPTTR